MAELKQRKQIGRNPQILENIITIVDFEATILNKKDLATFMSQFSWAEVNVKLKGLGMKCQLPIR